MTWLAISTLLVLLMQAGFACFEAGSVRQKNSINVAFKNVADLGLTTILFLIVGYPLMFGPSIDGWIGWGPSPIFGDDSGLQLNALFQAMFAGTAVTIVSGAVAERTSFRGYLTLATVIPITLYPLIGHWVWSDNGWLYALGFRDFAGGTVVHVVGGAIALAAAIFIGPRIGRFNSEGSIEPSNLAVTALGAFLLMFGWFGFNSGASTLTDTEVPLIIVNTAVGGAVGIFSAIALAFAFRHQLQATTLFTCMIGGLVGITAGCAYINPLGSMVLGVAGSMTALLGLVVLEYFEVDDPVGAVPVHMFSGIVGTALIPLVALESAMPEAVSSRLEWFIVQSVGTMGIALLVFFTAYLFLKMTQSIVQYRVTAEEERQGLNIAEHGAGSSLLNVLQQMHAQGESGDFSQAVTAEPETEAAYLAHFYNGVRERFVDQHSQVQALLKSTQHEADHDMLTGLFNRRVFYRVGNARLSEIDRHGDECSVLMLDLDHFKSVNDTHGHNVGDEVLKELAARLTEVARDSDLPARLGGEEFAVLLAKTNEQQALVFAERLRAGIADTPFMTEAGPLNITASMGVAQLDPQFKLDEIMATCDEALYRAKSQGRNRVVEASLPTAKMSDFR